MALETFSWCPRINAEQEVNFRRRTAQFGDGYQQVSGDGINPRSQKWNLQFTGNRTSCCSKHYGKRDYGDDYGYWYRDGK